MSGGATRDRTDTFIRYRDASRSGGRPFRPMDNAPERDGRLLAAALDNAGGGINSGDVTMELPPAWVDVSDEVAADMGRIKEKMQELNKAHGTSLLVTFDEDDISSKESTVEVLTQEVTRLFKRAEQNVRKFGMSDGKSTSEEDKVKKNVQVAMAGELQKLSVDFRRQQKEYLERMQRQKSGGKGGGGGSGALLDFDRELSASGDNSYDMGFTSGQLAVVGTNESLIQERDDEITSIVQNINDLAQVMKDLSVLVIDQGSILDQIDYNCEQVAVKVEQGVQELVKSEKTQKKSKMVFCILLLFAMVVFLAIMVTLKELIF